MAETLKVLGQLVPSPSTLTPLYVVGAAKGATVSSLVVCNQGASSVSVSVSIAVAAAADNPMQYVYSSLSIDPNDTFIATVGFTLANGDVIRVLASAGNVSFNLFGVELS